MMIDLHHQGPLPSITLPARLDWESMDGKDEYACATCCIEHVFVGGETLPSVIHRLTGTTSYQEVTLKITLSDFQVSGSAHPWLDEKEDNAS